METESTRLGSQAERSSWSSRRDSTPAGEPLATRLARRFTDGTVDPLDAVRWERRDAVIVGADGEMVFEQRGVEVPAGWSQTATNVVVSKYFRGALGTPMRESSVRQLIERVVAAVAEHALADGTCENAESARVLRDELAYLLVHQMASFNSPVWFNLGVEPVPQCSACFINSAHDDMGSILDLAKTEGMLFKHGSGTGSNLSVLRSSREALSGGGEASGPVSFMRGFDAFAGVIKSGGKSRRAAKMVILDIDHPDVVDFIHCKEREERKAWALIEAGYDSDFDARGGAYDSVFFQNANHSVRVSDSFMRAVEAGGTWTTHAVTSGEPMDRYPAAELLDRIASAAWTCGDPGLQFDDTINAWHTCPESGRIHASNPCSEFMFLDDTACNLASVNLLRFADSASGRFDAAAFRHACEVLVTAQEILVDASGYPTAAIERNSRRYRPLGLGFANLGALLMSWGYPYDSQEGRAVAGAIAALMTGAAYARSARLARAKGAFDGLAENHTAMAGVVRRHRDAVDAIDASRVPEGLIEAARTAFDEALEIGEVHGWRNSQVTAIAPTGTIAFMMDCDTTGVEPDVALVKYKRLVGGGQIEIVNRTVPLALDRLGYDSDRVAALVEHLERHGSLEGAPDLDPDHLPVFDCAFRAAEGTRSIEPLGHLRMLGAVQPFISGAISKTVNLPADASVEDVRGLFLESWRLGLKAVAIYRDGCKRSQPLSTEDSEAEGEVVRTAAPATVPPRRKLPDERRSITHKFSVGGHEGYLTVGMYEDGTPGEIFVVMAKEGSTISGLMDAFATSISIALQYGVPIDTLIDKFIHTRFEPSGFTNNRQIPIAKSVTDYIFRWLASKFASIDHQRGAGVIVEASAECASKSAERSGNRSPSQVSFLNQQDAPPCHECGSLMVRNGTCYKCLNCGSTSGCS